MCVGGSTSGLRHHLTSVHPDVMSSGKPSPQPSVASFCVGPRQCNDVRQEKITSLVTKVIVSNMLPLSLVDDQAFRELMSYVEPNYNIPCRQTFSMRLESTKAEVAKVVEEELESAYPTDSTPSSSSTDDDQPPAKQAKMDSRAASLRFLAKSAPQPLLQSDFERYLNAAVETDIDTLSWWSSNAVNYPATTTLASQYLSVPATSAQSERQFSAAGRLISKLCARLNGDRVDTLILLYKNM